MTSYYREGRGWYVDFTLTYPDGEKHRIRRKSPRNTRRAAEAFERDLRQQKLEEWRDRHLGIEEVDAPTLEEFDEEFREFLETEIASGNLKRSTVTEYKSIIRCHLVPFFGQTKLDEITPRDIEDYKALKRDEYAPKGVRNQLGVLSKLLSTAAYLEHIDSVPVIRTPSLAAKANQDAQQFEYWDFAEAERVLEVVDSEPRIANIIRLAMATGLRCGELCGLKWGDIDMVKRTLTVRRQVTRKRVTTPKSNRLRTVPLSDQALKALRLQKPNTFLRTHGEDDWVFVDDFGLFSPSRIADGYNRIVKSAGVKRIRFHDLRHTFASHAVMRGVPVQVLKEWMGHSDIRVTQRYAHLAPDYTQKFIDLMNADATHTSPKKSESGKPA